MQNKKRIKSFHSNRRLTESSSVLPVLTIIRGGIRSQVLVQLSDERIAEATLLLKHSHFTGAAYIVGYAVELLLKAVIATRFFASRWPINHIPQELKTHNFDKLLSGAQLESEMRHASRANPELGVNWNVARTWNPNLRYTRLPRIEASDIVGSVKDVPNGVALWLKVFADV